MSEDSSAKYYQNNKERPQKRRSYQRYQKISKSF